MLPLRRVSRLRLILIPIYISVAVLVVRPTNALGYVLTVLLIALFYLVELCYDREHKRDERAAADRAAAIERERTKRANWRDVLTTLQEADASCQPATPSYQEEASEETPAVLR